MDEAPDAHKDKDFKDFLNPESLSTLKGCKLEPFLAGVKPLDHFQFQRLGYFSADKDSRPLTVFNKAVGLKDSGPGAISSNCGQQKTLKVIKR